MGVNLNSLSMGITWTSLVPNAPLGEPQLFGTGVITAIQGDDTFTSDFGMIGDLVNIFANFPLTGPPCDLTELATGSEACSGAFQIVASFEGGDATPAGGGGGPGGGGMMPVPEPMSSFMALGLALFCLWGTYQSTRRERRHLGASA